VTEEKGVGLKGWLAGPGAKKARVQTESPPSLDKHRIAVLPLSNISPDPKDEYFADGISDELISTIAKIQGLHVIARTSSNKYKGSGKGISEIGQELRTGSIVEGTVRKAGDKLRITAQLVDTESEESLWSETYERQLGDVFHIQTDIARQVAAALQIKLFTAGKTRLEKQPTTNAEAYTLYLKGRFHYNKRTREDFRLAIDYFNRAIVTDPSFALAYAGLAASYASLGYLGMMPSKDAWAKARGNAERALGLDDSLAEAHHAMGLILRMYDWDSNGAEKEYDRAIQLNPSFAEAYTSRAILMLSMERCEDAITGARRALELDPLSALTAKYAGAAFLYCGRYDDAIGEYTRALTIEPEDPLSHNNLGLAYIQKGILDRGMAEVQRGNEGSNQGDTDLAYAYAKAGRLDDLRRLLEKLLSEVGKNHDLAIAVASAYANLGDRDHSMEWLERAYQEHVASLVYISNNFVFDNLREDPRFQKLLKKIRFKNMR
jgi:TolB-like protein/Tfp pilus assembly protein PilF